MKQCLLIVSLLMMTSLVLSLQTPVVAQSSDDVKRLEESLLTTPEKCPTLCVWNFQVGTETLADFRQFQVELIPQKAQLELQEASDGFYVGGIALHIAPVQEVQPTSVIEHLYVRVVVEDAKSAGVTLENFSPQAIIRSFGNPQFAYLLINKPQIAKSNRFRLILVYAPQKALYTVSGFLDEGKVCLAIENAEVLTLYRFAGWSAVKAYIQALSNNNSGEIPGYIDTVTNQTETDFLRIAANPATDCLTLK